MTSAPATPSAEATLAERNARGRKRNVRIGITFSVLAVVLAGAGYVAACATVPLPELEPTLAVPAISEVSADTAAVEAEVDARSLPTAIGWAHDDEVWSNDSTPKPLASLSKLITVLVCQEAAPLAPGEDGPTYTWTAEDVQRQAELVAINGVAFPIPAGTEISLRDMLKLIFLPSANDFAAAYAYSVFGDNETFLAAVADWAEHNEIDSLTMVEPTGMNENNQASADDLVRIARMVLENPTLAEFTDMATADIPGIGLVESSNPLIYEPGIVGLKTGTSSDAGYNLIVAQTTDVDGRELIKISVTLGRDSLEQRAESGRSMLASMEGLQQGFELVSDGETVGSVTTWTGEVVPLVTTGAANATLLPGEDASRTITLNGVSATPAATSGGEITVGEITVDSPTGSERVGVVTGAAIVEPDLWWRLTHPTAVLGWR